VNDRVDSWSAFKPWVTQACAAVGQSPDEVDITAVLDVAAQVAHGVARPMAPVSTFILGLAIGRGADPEVARAALLGTVPAPPSP
jgi:hypothetical protein